MPIVFRVEPVAPIWDQVKKNVQSETDFNPDQRMYFELNRNGVLRFYTARIGNALVGHGGMYVHVPPHTGKVTASDDYWYLAPEVRKGWNAANFMEYVESDLKGIGVEIIILSATIGSDTGKFIKARGYTPKSVIYEKGL